MGHTRVQKKAKLQQPKVAYSLQQARGVHVQSAAPFDSVGGSVLTGLLTDHVARHKHGDEVTRGEPALIGLETTRERALATLVAGAGEERLCWETGTFEPEQYPTVS